MGEGSSECKSESTRWIHTVREGNRGEGRDSLVISVCSRLVCIITCCNIHYLRELMMDHAIKRERERITSLSFDTLWEADPHYARRLSKARVEIPWLSLYVLGLYHCF